MGNIFRVRSGKDFVSIPCLVGEPAKLLAHETTYQYSEQGITPPSGMWTSEPGPLRQGEYLWMRVVDQWNRGAAQYTYTAVYQGMDGTGSVNTVNGVSPDKGHNVTIGLQNLKGDATHRTVTDAEKETWNGAKTTAEKALPKSGGIMTGGIAMGGNAISGLPEPVEDGDAASKGYADSIKPAWLWSNPDPSVPFDAQVVDLPGLSNYRFLAIDVQFMPESLDTYGLQVFPVQSGKRGWLEILSSPARFFQCRSFTISGETVSFDDASLGSITDRELVVDNTRVIPLKIYGIK